MNDPNRFCPICETAMDDAVCAADGVPTVLRSGIDEGGQLLATGTMIASRYRIEGLVARGGMGDVYSAVQTSMNRRVAVKTLLKDLQREPQLLKRFYREAKSASLVDHPNVVRIFDFGVDDDTSVPYIAMEFLEGTTLTRVMREHGPFPETRAAGILVGVCRALAAAHAKSLVHRDLKPENIQVQQLCDGEEHIKVFDFGIAKMQRKAGDTNKSMTEAGVAIGTPQYMSPEQAIGRRVDHRADLYSVGCILYEMLVGVPPFDGPEIMPILVDQAGKPPPKLPPLLPTGRAPSPALMALYDGLMHKEPESRPGTAKLVTRILRALARGEREIQSFDDHDDPATIPPMPSGAGMLAPNPMPTAHSAEDSVAGVVDSSYAEAPTVAHPSASELAVAMVQPAGGKSTVAGLTPADPLPVSMDQGTAATVAAPSVEQPAVLPLVTAPSPAPSMSRPAIAAPETVSAPSQPMIPLVETEGEAPAGSVAIEANAKTPLIIAAVILLGAGLLFVSLGGESKPAASPAETSNPAPANEVVLTAVSVTINSTPTGAEIFRGEERLGTTPYTLALPKDDFPIEVQLKKAGYGATGTTLREGLGAVMVHLTPQPKPTVPAAVLPAPVDTEPAPAKAAPLPPPVKPATPARKVAPPKKAPPKKAAVKKVPPKTSAPKTPPKKRPEKSADKDVEVEAW